MLHAKVQNNSYYSSSSFVVSFCQRHARWSFRHCLSYSIQSTDGRPQPASNQPRSNARLLLRGPEIPPNLWARHRALSLLGGYDHLWYLAYQCHNFISIFIIGIGCSLYIFVACLICTERHSTQIFVRPLSYTSLNQAGKSKDLPDEPRERVFIPSSSNSPSPKDTLSKSESNNDLPRGKSAKESCSVVKNRYFSKENQVQTSILTHESLNFEKMNRAHTLSTIRSKSLMADDNFCDSIARALSLRW